jgi:hypothetical protein
MFRRSSVLAVRGFEEDRKLSGHEDWDLLLRLAAAGNRFVTVRDEVAAYRVTGLSVSWNVPRMFASGMLALRRACGLHRDCPECRKAIGLGRKNQRRFYAGIGFGGGLDKADALGDMALVFANAIRAVRSDPELLPYLMKAILLRPWRRGISSKAIATAAGR